MCSYGAAAAAAMLAIAAVSSVAQYNTQKAEYAATEENALNAYAIDSALIGRRQEQEQEAAAQRKVSNQREYDATRARAVVAAEEAGVSGLSVDALLADLAGQQSDRQKAVDTNLNMSIQQLQAEKNGAAVSRDSRLNSNFAPSSAALAIEIGGQALSAYSGYKTNTDPKWSKPNG